MSDSQSAVAERIGAVTDNDSHQIVSVILRDSGERVMYLKFYVDPDERRIVIVNCDRSEGDSIHRRHHLVEKRDDIQCEARGAILNRLERLVLKIEINVVIPHQVLIDGRWILCSRR